LEEGLAVDCPLAFVQHQEQVHILQQDGIELGLVLIAWYSGPSTYDAQYCTSMGGNIIPCNKQIQYPYV